MRIFQTKKDGGIVFINMSEDEGLELIEGIAAQLRARNTNTGRAEFRCSETGQYFSVSVKRDGPRISAFPDCLAPVVRARRKTSSKDKAKD